MTFATRIRQMIYISLALILVQGLTGATSTAAQAAVSPLLIYQVQTGASASATQEYISVYNNTDQPADVTNWCVNYSSSSDLSQTQLGCLKPQNNTTKLFLPPHKSFILATSDMVQAHPGLVPDLVFTAGIAGTSGHIKLIAPDKHIADIVGWATAAHPEGAAVTAAASGKIIQRHNTVELLQDTDNNSLNFYQTELIILNSGNIYEESIPVPDSPMPTISELLPDVAGADDGKEFIELYNPSDQSIDLALYSLAIGPNFSKLYPLPDVILEPKDYISFNDIETGLTLPNTSATLRMIGPYDRTVSEVSYFDPEEDTAFAYINNSWQSTYRPTPGTENILVISKPCPEGQNRSTETGQCKTITLAASVLECKLGQLRNPETGRCKNITTATAAVVACKIGQEKNPATNRCRNIVAANTAKPCLAGQERNPDTGRCKKITSAAGTGANSVKDVASSTITNNIKWWIAGAAATGSVAYGIYEWRNELLSFTVNLKNKLVPG